MTATPTGSKVDGSSQLTRISDDSIVFADDSRNSPIMLAQPKTSQQIPSYKDDSPGCTDCLAAPDGGLIKVIQDGFKRAVNARLVENYDEIYASDFDS